VNEKPNATLEWTTDADTRARIVRELHELIAALDRRVPQVRRVGEVAIASAAAALKAEAVKRIATIEREPHAERTRSTPSRGTGGR
jgi:hypothetical protein